MGLDYAFELIAERTAGDRLLRTLAEYVTPEDSELLLACLPFDAQQPLRRYGRDHLKGMRDVCLSFLFPPDELLEGYSKDTGRARVNGLIPVGCIYSSFKVGEQILVFRAAAATTDMSRLFEQSPSVLETWRMIAAQAGALLLLLDDEKFDNWAIWPVERRLGRPDYVGSSDDARYLALVRAAGVQVGDESNNAGA